MDAGLSVAKQKAPRHHVLNKWLIVQSSAVPIATVVSWVSGNGNSRGFHASLFSCGGVS